MHSADGRQPAASPQASTSGSGAVARSASQGLVQPDLDSADAPPMVSFPPARDTADALRPTEARVLLVESGYANGRSARAAFDGDGTGAFVVESAISLEDGLERLREGVFAAILLDVPPPECRAALERIWVVAPHVPILVIGAPIARDRPAPAGDPGVLDYLSREHIDGDALTRALTRVIERQAVDEVLFLERQRPEVTLNSIGDAVLTVDLAGHVTYLNPVAERMTGWSRSEAAGRSLEDVFRPVDGKTRQPVRNPLAHAIRLDRTVGLTPNCLLVRRDGFETAIEDSASPIHDRRGRAVGAVIVFRDVAEARAASEQNIHRAQHDPLTDLPNRLLMHDRLSQAMAMARRQGHRLAVLFLDLDGFKAVNDSFGHSVGDRLLQSVARRLVECVRDSDTVSRQGGDEFVVLLSRIAHADDAAASALKIIAAIDAPHHVAGHRLHVSATVGIGIYPDDGVDAETLVNCADIAMYRAKVAGRQDGGLSVRNTLLHPLGSRRHPPLDEGGRQRSRGDERLPPRRDLGSPNR
jgi:diguanylate cyclase (GGDEF)-like protein/PAS domain S-box-containing protein